ncbi:hypothetical protein [Thermococcus sp. MV11]|uniref:hypothetical protein n=1 Tax=Thermococcus sp. MV11 TaxID=1638267 RepID=UPI0014318753|nr:hypothetical protein [Thermococcus sp. MV11]NJE02779.1 hypothetical protein [Thermococcus sp. MV11]
MNLGRILLAAMIIVAVIGTAYSISEYLSENGDCKLGMSEPPKTNYHVSYQICPYVQNGTIKGYAEEVYSPRSLGNILVKAFNDSLDPNYPLAVVRYLAEQGKLRAYSEYFYLEFDENGSRESSVRSEWVPTESPDDRFIVYPPRDMFLDNDTFDFLGGWVYSEMDGRGVLVVYYLANPETVKGIDDVTVIYPPSWGIESSTSTLLWQCWPESGTIMTCNETDENSKHSSFPKAYGGLDSAGFNATWPYGAFALAFNTTYGGDDRPPLCVRFGLETIWGKRKAPMNCEVSGVSLP